MVFIVKVTYAHSLSAYRSIFLKKCCTTHIPPPGSLQYPRKKRLHWFTQAEITFLQKLVRNKLQLEKRMLSCCWWNLKRNILASLNWGATACLDDTLRNLLVYQRIYIVHCGFQCRDYPITNFPSAPYNLITKIVMQALKLIGDQHLDCFLRLFWNSVRFSIGWFCLLIWSWWLSVTG